MPTPLPSGIRKFDATDPINRTAFNDNWETIDTAIGDLSELETTEKGNIVGAVNELFTSVSDGKALIASAITDKGVDTEATDSFATMADNIENIPEPVVGVTETIEYGETITKNDLVTLVRNRIRLPAPTNPPTGTGNDVAFSHDDAYMAVAHSVSPYITIYKRSGDTFTKLSDPVDLPTGNGYGVAFSSDSLYMAVAHNAAPSITIYKRSGDTFTKLSNPSNLPTGVGYSVAFSHDDAYMTVAHATSPYITIYKRSGDSFAKLPNPISSPGSTSNGVAFSSDSLYMAVAHNNSPYLTIYKRSGDTFTKLTVGGGPFNYGNGRCVAFSPDTTKLILGCTSYPFVVYFQRVYGDDIFTRIQDLTAFENIPSPPGTGNGVAFSSNGEYWAMSHSIQPHTMLCKEFQTGGLFPRYIRMVTSGQLISGDGNGISISSDNAYIAVACASSPYVAIYKTKSLAYVNDGNIAHSNVRGAYAIGYANESGDAEDVREVTILWT